MVETFRIDEHNDFMLADHYFFTDMLRVQAAEDKKKLEKVMKDTLPIIINKAREVNPNYRLFIPEYCAIPFEMQHNEKFIKIVNAYLEKFADWFPSAQYFSTGEDPGESGMHLDEEIDFFKNFIQAMRTDDPTKKAVLLTSYSHALELADRLVNAGISRVIGFSPEDGFVEFRAVELNENDIVYVRNKQCKLGKEIGNGGEAKVFELFPGYLAKIYKTSIDPKTFLPNCVKFQEQMKLRKNKFKAFFTNENYRINDPNIILPLEEIYDQYGNMIGIIMKRAEGIDLFDIVAKNQFPFSDFKRSELLKISKEIAKKIKKLHEHGIVMGDMNLNNFLVDAKSPENIKVSVIDLDGCQIKGYPSHYETPEFSDPLWLERVQKRGTMERTFENECYTLMIIIFHVLFSGRHPYQQIKTNNWKESMLNRDYPYKINESDIKVIKENYGIILNRKALETNLVAPADANYINSHLDRKMKSLFYLTFANQGKDFRPSIEQIVEAIDDNLTYTEKWPDNNKLKFNNFGMSTRDRLYFKCSKKDCQKDYYYHVNKVFTARERGEKYLYCNECLTMFENWIKKYLIDPEKTKEEKDEINSMWFSSLFPQDLDALLAEFYNDSTKNHNNIERWQALNASKFVASTRENSFNKKTSSKSSVDIKNSPPLNRTKSQTSTRVRNQSEIPTRPRPAPPKPKPKSEPDQSSSLQGILNSIKGFLK